MSFLNINSLNTTTQVTPSLGGTSTVSRLFDRDEDKQFGSGDTSDATTTTIQIDFVSTQTIDKIILQNINFKSFKMYHSGVTASTFTLSNNITTTSDWSTNSLTNMYLIINSATAFTQLNIDISTTAVAASEKKMGQLWITSLNTELTDNPSAKQYKAKIKRKEFPVEMSNGGTDIYWVDENFQVNINLKYVSTTVQTALKSIYSGNDHSVFVPEPTGTSWVGTIYAVNWVGDFGQQWTKDFKNTGQNQIMKLKEIAK